MTRIRRHVLFLLGLAALGYLGGSVGSATAPVDLNTPRDFPKVASLAEWRDRAKDIREQVLVSCGLWPMPPKAPLRAHIFDKIERDGYSVEKVYFQTYPGFYLAGNLYRPLGRGKGPFPAILNPHGHWKEGRLADNKDGSIAARCISFARQGMIAFSYDMVGYNDTRFANSPAAKAGYDVHHDFSTDATDLLWSISSMGLQTWNSIRALDFLEALTDADPKRLACTGESGGGTQTFMLGAVDGRLALQAPIVMVSHTMQGGCSCENVSGLRVEYSNMEIAAAAAPRPQILVAASGDWTKDTLTVEGPAIAQIYDLFQAPERFHFERFNFGHNYNQTSREAVYGWFGKWLLKTPEASRITEAAYTKEPDSALRVFPGQLPADALTREEFIDSLRKLRQAQWQKSRPRNKRELENFKQQNLPAWRHTLQLERPGSSRLIVAGKPNLSDRISTAALTISREGKPGAISATYRAPENIKAARSPRLVVLAPAGEDGSRADRGDDLAKKLLNQGCAVLEIRQYSTGDPPDQFANFYSTYNRTKLQERVGDLLTLCAAAKEFDGGAGKPLPFQVILVGIGSAGLWSLLAAPGADAVIADSDSLSSTDDQALLKPDLFCPGIRAIGSFEGAALLAAPHPLLIHNTGGLFTTGALRQAYQGTRNLQKLRVESSRLPADDLANWIAALK